LCEKKVLSQSSLHKPTAAVQRKVVAFSEKRFRTGSSLANIETGGSAESFA
jgi:hypothetical protein